MLDCVIVRFKRPSSKVQSLPSESLNLALTSLARHLPSRFFKTAMDNQFSSISKSRVYEKLRQ
jgi:hypothetical protein